MAQFRSNKGLIHSIVGLTIATAFLVADLIYQ